MTDSTIPCGKADERYQPQEHCLFCLEMSCLLCQTLQGEVYEMYESSSYLRLCLGMQGGRGMEVTPLALTSTSVADQFPVGRQLHQAQPCICSSHNICHIVIPRTSTRSCVILRAHPHSQLTLTVSSASQSAQPHTQFVLTLNTILKDSSSHVQAHESDLCVHFLVPAMLTALLLHCWSTHQ